MMKDYIKRIKDGVSLPQLIFWWIIRASMIYAFVKGFFPSEGKQFDITDPLQVGANLIATFVWEIFMLFPPKSIFRHVTSGFQNFLIVGIWCASFGGKFLNLYYSFRWWDVFLHLLGGAACVFFGYELACAILKRDKAKAPLSLILLASVGFSFLAATAWEVFEFVFDQISCMSGSVGDAQHWSIEMAKGTPKEATLFDPVYTDRWAIMDTMADIVMNTAGAFISYIIIRIYPYRHKGRYAFDFLKTGK